MHFSDLSTGLSDIFLAAFVAIAFLKLSGL
jgi:hypothetical protein